MANPSKAKGTRAETKVCKYLESFGWVARRQALAGAADQGDIEAYRPDSVEKIIIEVKAGIQTKAPNRTQINEWCRQADTEKENAGARSGVLIVVRYNRAIEDADVYIPYGKMRTHWYLEDWVKSITRNDKE